MTDVPREDARDESILRDEFTRQYPDIRRRVCAYVRLRNPWLDADSVADEVIERTWKNWKQVRECDSVMSWVLTVTHNLMIDLRKSNTASPREINDADVALVAPHADAQTRAELLETLKAMHKLPDRLREALQSSVAGFSPAEIAEAMSCEPRTVSRYVSEARRQLNRILGRRPGRHRMRASQPRPLLPETFIRHDTSPDREDEKG